MRRGNADHQSGAAHSDRLDNLNVRDGEVHAGWDVLDGADADGPIPAAVHAVRSTGKAASQHAHEQGSTAGEMREG